MHESDIITCLVTAEALEHHFEARSLSFDECLAAFQRHREEIQLYATNKILAGEFEEPNQIILKTTDFIKSATTTTAEPNLKSAGFAATSHDTGDYQLDWGVIHANHVLEQLAGDRTNITGEWKAVQLPSGDTIMKLTLTDKETEVQQPAIYDRSALVDRSFMNHSLFRLWDDLLRKRGEALLDALNRFSGSKE